METTISFHCMFVRVNGRSFECKVSTQGISSVPSVTTGPSTRLSFPCIHTNGIPWDKIREPTAAAVAVVAAAVCFRIPFGVFSLPNVFLVFIRGRAATGAMPVSYRAHGSVLLLVKYLYFHYET